MISRRSQVIGMRNEKLNADMHSSENFLRSYMRSLARHPHAYRAPHVLAVESNMGRESSWMEGVVARGRDLSEFANARVLRETWNSEAKAFRSGVHTDGNVKFEAVQLLELLMNADCLRFSQNLTCSDGRPSTGDDEGGSSDEVAAVIEELRDQLTRWRKIPLPTRTIDGAERFGFSAKAGPDDKVSAKLQDDLVMALLLCVYWLRKFMARELRNYSYD